MESPACCFTGYRPGKFPFPCRPGNPDYNRFENRLYDAILSLVQAGYRTFYDGLAAGFDLIAAELVLSVRALDPATPVRLVGVVPYDGQESDWSSDWKARYGAVVRQADEVTVLSPTYFRGCYQVRNRYLVDHSSLVLAYYDGRPGGTRSTLEYARRQGISVCNFIPDDAAGVGIFPLYLANAQESFL